MKMAILMMILIFASSALGTPNTELWQSLLTKHVSKSGGVNYAGFKKDEMKLDSFIKSHVIIKLSGTSDSFKKAVYINLYNATMIKNLLRYAAYRNIKISSQKFLDLEINKIEVPGGNIWDGDYKVRLSRASVNLDDIEHKLIRGDSDLKNRVSKLDPRIHAAVNCAALSCPRVREIAYTEKNIDKLLNENMSEYISKDKYFSRSGDKMVANSIVFWYYPDFDDYAQDVLKLGGAGSYLSRFMRTGTKERAWKIQRLKKLDDRSRLTLKMSSDFDFRYNWKINDIRNR